MNLTPGAPLNPGSAAAGPEARVLKTSARHVSLAVGGSGHYRLVVLVPTNDSKTLAPYQLLYPDEGTATISTSGKDNLRIWTATLSDTGRRGLWTIGPKVPKIHKVETVENKTYVVELAENFTIENATLKYPTLRAVFRWNSSEENEEFLVTNICERLDLGETYINTTNEPSVSLTGLVLNDTCTLTVRAQLGQGSLVYRTPESIGEHYVPEIPQNVSITSSPGLQAWSVRVRWAPPRRRPLLYTVTVHATNTVNVTVAGNATSATVTDVVGEDLFNVTIVAVTPRGNAHVTRRALFPRPSTLGLTITGSSSAVLLFAILAVGVLIMRNRRKPDPNDWYPDTISTSPSKGYTLDTFADVSLAPDGWEVRAERLRLHEVLGEGAFGVVRRGTLAPAAADVAVKMLKDCPSVEEVRSFRAEMELMKSVGAHPHVVSLLGCCSRARPMIIAEYCARGDLLNYLRCAWGIMVSKRNAKYYNNNTEVSSNYRNDLFKNLAIKDYSKLVVNKLYDLQGVCDSELTQVDLLSFCRQIAMGMEFLASNRVVHRDLAARNVLVSSDRTLKIADFGLSRDVYQENQYKQKGSAKLPIKWMALESLTHRIYTSQSDVWSFGVVMWEVVTVGGSPYPGVSAAQLPRLLRTGYRMPKPSNCSKQLYELMQSCWSSRARDRPTFTELHRALDSLLNAQAQDYLTLELDDDAPATPRPPRHRGLLARTKRYWSNKTDIYNKVEIYERPLKTSPSNHYTSPPDTLSRTQIV
ncbi:tyrosine-protein kinase receptor torso [Plutella xylostella]|uniref:tyrosine-protein kinase receptor torso n=1 Tax=Plutella xylostella TaxID=51655 RepID=UPI002032E7B2|nr:tyrosine-protein kinase receptor torso [Plutella xylostella]